MTENTFNFVTQTHEGNSEAVICQSIMISKLYPESEFYVYDGGLSQSTKDKLSDHTNTNIIDWKKQADFSRNFGTFQDILTQIESKIKSNNYTDFLVGKLLDYDYTHKDITQFDFYVRQKPNSILDLTRRVDGPIIWMDDDAIIINHIDKVLQHEFDVGVTVRSKYASKYQPYSPVNSGVIIFNTNSISTRKFTEKWLDVIENSELSKFREQNAVEHILRESNENIFDSYYNIGNIKVRSTQLKAITLPCYKYNHFVFNYGINPSKNKILHFKSDYLDKDVNKELLDDIMSGDLSEWQR